MKPNIIRKLATTLILSAAVIPAITAAEAAPTADDHPVIGLQQKAAVKMVIQMTSGDLKDGVSAALTKIKKIHQDYTDEGVAPEALSLRVVIHGDAAAHVLTDAAWPKHQGGADKNPNTQLIDELVEKGVHLELCNSRRLRNGWEKSEIHPGVALVGNAYLRLADLQLEGYAYVRL